MRRSTTVALVAAILLALSAGAALAAVINCTGGFCEGTPGDDTMNGTPGVDEMHALAGNDALRGEEGNDTMYGDDGDDSLHMVSGDNTAFGGPEDDGLTGSNGADKLHGEDGEDFVVGGSGSDTLAGGPDEDEILAREQPAAPADKDSVNCGAGSTDWAYFDKGIDSVTRDCERLEWTRKELPSCASRPWDNASVKCINGTKRADKLVARDNPDARMVDVIWAKGGNDTLHGRRGYNVLVGGKGGDTLKGGPGEDGLFSYGATWTFEGRPPSGEGSDKLYGGDGDDLIDAIDGTPDTISCGGGDDDWAQIDPDLDTIVAPAKCERITDHREPFWHWKRWCARRR